MKINQLIKTCFTFNLYIIFLLANTHSFSCHEACKDIFRTKLTPSKELRIKVTDKCEEHSPKVMQCIRNYTKVTPVNNPLKCKLYFIFFFQNNKYF